MVAINGRNLDARYVWGDELPVLNYSNGYYGAYTVSVYDRSGNALEFVIYIAGEDPSLKHTSKVCLRRSLFFRPLLRPGTLQ